MKNLLDSYDIVAEPRKTRMKKTNKQKQREIEGGERERLPITNNHTFLNRRSAVAIQ